ncbi:MAG: alanine racemase [Firmicutes bacterium]|nr:alanine racemase [Bacillota bacterium]MDD3298378.1 alanine racemase [Bacillota bacterium]MDD4707922.1 alanine racemase [Bacillota bacterium]
MISGIRPVWLEVNLDNLAHNIRQIKENVRPPASLMGIVKADGYGHGALEVSRVLIEEGVQRLGVAVLDEAIELRQAEIDFPILVLGYTPAELFDKVLEYNITPTLYNYEDALKLSELASKKGDRAKVHLKLDTGMGRIGMLPGEDSIDTVSNIYKLQGIIIEGIFTHFSVADERDKTYTREQYKKFIGFTDALKAKGIDIPLRHAGNSAASIDLPDMHLDMVRPGIILYGLYPSDEVDKGKLSLKPLASLKAAISHVKTVPTGTSVGYGRKYISTSESVIATLPLGYADGYTRLLSGKADVLVHGARVPLAGNICMDQCMIDVTGIDGVKVGDEAVLMGQQGEQSITAEELGGLLGTINYEIVCMIGKRVPRVYIKDGKIQKIEFGVGR